MSARSVTSTSLLRSGVSVWAVVGMLVSFPLSAQTPQGDAASGEVPMTAWGHPDLQGNWTNATLTPFERRSNHGPILTPEQVFAIEQGQADAVAENSQASDPDRPLPPGGDDPVCIDGATTCYNEVYRDPGDRVAVVDGEPRSSLLTRPANGRVPELTPEGRRRAEEYRNLRGQFGDFDHPEVRPLAERCLVSFGSSAGPPMLPNYWYNNNYTIVQNEDHVMIMAEMVHDVRIVRLSEPEPLPGEIRPWFGDSWGRWDGITLVVETTNINPEHPFRGIPASEQMRVIERFTPIDEGSFLYEFTIDDPLHYTEAWGGEIPFRRLNDLVYEYACHEGNYALDNILSGARYQESLEAQEQTEPR